MTFLFVKKCTFSLDLLNTKTPVITCSFKDVLSLWYVFFLECISYIYKKSSFYIIK